MRVLVDLISSCSFGLRILHICENFDSIEDEATAHRCFTILNVLKPFAYFMKHTVDRLNKGYT